MKDDYFFIASPDDSQIKAEKNKARQLRKTRWWQQKTSSGKCYYCGQKVGFANLTMDHVIPLSRGGSSRKDNLVPCCKDCNNKKKSFLPIEWDDYMNELDKNKV